MVNLFTAPLQHGTAMCLWCIASLATTKLPFCDGATAWRAVQTLRETVVVEWRRW
jgi:hypothetical protein